jgi:hypothetical protein
MDMEIRSRNFKCIIGALTLVLLLSIPGCASKNVIFSTTSVIGLDVSGTGTGLPNHVSVAYDRGEMVYAPRGNVLEPSVLGTLDSELTWFNGVAIGETFATGNAARTVHGSKVVSKKENLEPLLVLTGTRFGLNLDAGQEGLNAPSLLAGYKRFNLAVVPPKPDSDEIQSVYADISIHSSGIAGKFEPDNPNLKDRQLSEDHGGVRIVQTIATGKAATDFVDQNRSAVAERLTPAAQFNERAQDYNVIASIMNQYQGLSSDKRILFVNKLNDLTGCERMDTDTRSIRLRLHSLSQNSLGKLLEDVKIISEE